MKSTNENNNAAVRAELFALTINADFYKKALLLMGSAPELLSGEADTSRAPGVHHPPSLADKKRGSQEDILNNGINAALAKTGALLGVSRAYVMRDENDGRYLRNTHEWVDGKISPAMYSWPLHDYEKDIPSLKPLMEGKLFLAAHTGELPPDLQRVLAMQGVDSVLLVPLLRDGSWIGLAGFDSCGVERDWREEEIVILQHLSRLIGLFLERLEYSGARRVIGAIRELLGESFSPVRSGERGPGAADGQDDPVPQYSPHLERWRRAPLAMTCEATGWSGRHGTAGLSLQEAERRLIVETLARCNGNKSRAAKSLGLKWAALDRRCRKLGITRDSAP